MELITRTVYGSALQSALFSDIPFAMNEDTTLNKKFGVLSGVAPTAGQMPKAKYFCIGAGGHQLATGTGGVALIQAVEHLATDASLYEPLPFILRAINNDIAPSVQTEYALRKQITVGGSQYYAYYLKRIDTSAAVVDTTLQTVVGGVTTSASFIPDSTNLDPTPPVIVGGVNVLTSQYAVCSATLPISFTQQECTELLNAATILYGDPSYAIISEIGITSGVEYPITLPNGNSFTEVIAAQIATFINTMHVVQYTSTGISGSYQLGTSEPMLTLG